MLRFSLGVSSKDRIRNNYIRGTGKVGLLGGKVREIRLGGLAMFCGVTCSTSVEDC